MLTTNVSDPLARVPGAVKFAVAITDGKLHLGPWEHIFYFEFDGQRRKRVLVKIIGERDAMRDDTSEVKEGVWCVVANVKREHPVGEGGEETKIGTRQFRGGTKVYIGGCYPGPCDGVVCIGLHRKSRNFITCVVSVTHVENFRPKVAYHPEVVRRLQEDERCWFRTEDDAEMWAAEFPKWQEIWRPTDKSAPEDE